MQSPGTRLSTYCEKKKSNPTVKDARAPIVTDNTGNRNCNNKSPLRSNLKKFPAHWEKLLQKANVHFSSNFQLNSERGDTDAVVVLSKSVKDRTATAVTQLCERKETRYYQLLLPHEEAEKYLCEAKGEVIKKKQHKRR